MQQVACLTGTSGRCSSCFLGQRTAVQLAVQRDRFCHGSRIASLVIVEFIFLFDILFGWHSTVVPLAHHREFLDAS